MPHINHRHPSSLMHQSWRELKESSETNISSRPRSGCVYAASTIARTAHGVCVRVALAPRAMKAPYATYVSGVCSKH